MADLKLLHRNLLLKLKMDGFIANSEKEMLFEMVDFSKTYPAKSGDLISYFYRTSNLIRAVSFKNLENLSFSLEQDIHSNKALVILEDYVGTGTQFLFELYSKCHHDLFNSYKKVYFVVLVATKSAVSRFEKITHGDYESLVQDFISIMNIQDESAKKEILANVRNIAKDKLEIIYLHKEIPLNDSSRNPETTHKLLALLDKSHIPLVGHFFFDFSIFDPNLTNFEQYGINIAAKLANPAEKTINSNQKQPTSGMWDKYNIKRYLEGNFSSFSHTVFFYNCPNNLPEILWNSQSIHRDGTPWIPLFKRVEDLSIYDIAETIPIEEQIW